MNRLIVKDITGKKAENFELPPSMEGHVNSKVLYQAVNKYRASMRQGTASVKERTSVSGGGKKPFRQKGTGRARAGSSRSPLWIKGGIVFGPRPRDFSYSLPQKIRHVALREAFKSRLQSDSVVCIEDFKQKIEKTKEMAKVLDKLSIKEKTLAIFDGCEKSLERAARNIPFICLAPARDITAFDVLRHQKILISKSGLKTLLDRIEK